MTNKEKREMEKFKKVTLYISGGLGITKIEASQCEVERGVKYAQYDNATRFKYKKPRQRKWRGGVETSYPSLVILDGWGHLNPDDPMTETRDGDFVVKKSRFGMFSNEYNKEFDAKLAAYLEKNPQVKVLVDLRESNPYDRFQSAG